MSGNTFGSGTVHSEEERMNPALNTGRRRRQDTKTPRKPAGNGTVQQPPASFTGREIRPHRDWSESAFRHGKSVKQESNPEKPPFISWIGSSCTRPACVRDIENSVRGVAPPMIGNALAAGVTEPTLRRLVDGTGETNRNRKHNDVARGHSQVPRRKRLYPPD